MRQNLRIPHTGSATGFSMVELMVVLAIAVVLIGIAAPNFRSLIQKQRLVTTVNDFFSAINLTRSEAIQRGGRVDLVPAKDGDWSSGWVVFVDGNNDQKLDTGEKIIFSHGPISGGIKIEAGLTDSKVQYLAYNGAGRTRTNGDGDTPNYGSFKFELDDRIRKIIINQLGRPRVCNPDVVGEDC